MKGLLQWLRQWFADAREAKWIVGLGDLAFGPPCRECGRPRFELAPRRAREVLNRMSVRECGRPLDEAPGMCHCSQGGP